MTVTAIMATCGRHLCSERSLAFFLRQEYEKKHLLIFQNSPVCQALDPRIDPSLVTLVNNHLNTRTNRPYETLGDIYQDALLFLPEGTDVVTFWDDDDLFLDTHLKDGVAGVIRGGKMAYKPATSFYRTGYAEITRVENTLEPSIFVRLSYLQKWGFSSTTSDQHLQWIRPLLDENAIFVDPHGNSTLIYNWGDLVSSVKTSGLGLHEGSFDAYRKTAGQHGDGIISPANIDRFYKDLADAVHQAV